MTKIGTAIRTGVCGATLAMLMAGCVVHDTRPLPKINATQASSEIPEDELLDVAVHAFDPGVPPAIAKNEQALNKKRIYPDIRRAESRYVATMLRGTLETSGLPTTRGTTASARTTCWAFSASVTRSR